MNELPPSLHRVNLLELRRTVHVVDDEPVAANETDEQWADGPASAGRGLDDFSTAPVVVLVGAAGAGKTAELYRWYRRTSRSRWFNLVQLGSLLELTPGELGADVDTVFVDGCDEFDGKPGPLLAALGRLASAGIRLRISARAAWWTQQASVAAAIPDRTTISLEPLSEPAIEALVAGSGVAASVVDFARTAGAADVLTNPRLLVSLAKVHRQGVRPNTRLQLYERIVALDAIELNRHVDTLEGAAGPDVVDVARRVAAVSVFGRRSLMVADASEAGEQRLDVSTFASPTVVARFLASRLVVPSTEGWVFADRTVAEYLAAAELARHLGGRRASERWLQLLAASVGGERFIPPPLRGVAGWAAEHDATAFNIVLDIDPVILVEQPGARYSDIQHAMLAEAVLGSNSVAHAIDGQTGLAAACVAAVDDTPHDLHAVVADRAGVEDRRVRALQLIDASGRRDFDDLAADLVCDPKAAFLPRFWAMLVVAKTETPAVLHRVYDVVVSSAAPADPDLRIFGLLLDAMWPRHLRTGDLVKLLRPPVRRGLFEYELFLGGRLWTNATAADAVALIGWCAALRDADHRADRRAVQLVRWATGVLAEPLDTEVRSAIGCAFAAAPAIFEQVPVGALGEFIGTLRLDEMVTIADGCVAQMIEPRPLGATGRLFALFFAHPDLACAAQFRATTLDRIEAAGSDATRDVWLHAFGFGWRSSIADHELRHRVSTMTSPGGHRLRMMIEAAELDASTLDTVAEDDHGTEVWDGVVDPILERLQLVAGGTIGWESLVVSDVLADGGLWDAARVDAIDQPTHHRLLELAERAAGIMPVVVHDDAQSVATLTVAWVMAVETVAWLDGIGPAAALIARCPAAALRCRRLWFRSDRFVAACVLAAAEHPVEVLDGATAELAGLARHDANGGRRVDWLHDLRSIAAALADRVRNLCTDLRFASDARAALIRELAALGAVAPIDATAILATFVGTADFGTAVVHLHTHGAALPLDGRSDDDLRSVVTAAAAATYGSDDAWSLRDVTTGDVASLYRHAARLFPKTSYESGYVAPTDTDRFRERCITELVNRGGDALDALVGLAATASLSQLLGPSRLDQVLEAAWTPLAPAEIAIVLDEPERFIVNTGADLIAAIIDCLDRYQEDLTASGNAPSLLRETDGSPRAEPLLSSDLLRTLRARLLARHSVVNREVELRPPKADAVEPPGENADLLVTATNGSSTISVVVEVKGSWHQAWKTAAQDQLTDRYLAHSDVHGGVYVVFWFDRETWPTNDPRRRRSPAALNDVRAELEGWTAVGTRKPVSTYVIDASHAAGSSTATA